MCSTCTPISESIDNTLDIANLYENLASNFAGVVQYNKDNRPNVSLSIDDVCQVMVNESIGPQFTRLAMVNSMLLDQSTEKCLNYRYKDLIDGMTNSSWQSEMATGMRQWIWQTCNEFGYYQTSESNNSMFGDRFAINFFTQQCADIYGEG